MTSFIISTTTTEEGDQEALKYCKNFDIHINDIHIINPTTLKEGGSSSLKIRDVHAMIEKASLKPLRGSTKAIILSQAELLTIPAQNALLKLLEEPPAHTIIILATTNLSSLLPTIQSRCKIIKIHMNNIELSKEEKKQLQEQLHNIMHQPLGDVLRTAEQLTKNKTDTLLWMEQTINLLRGDLLERINTNYPIDKLDSSLHLLQKTYRTIFSTNANLRLAIETLFLSLRQ